MSFPLSLHFDSDVCAVCAFSEKMIEDDNDFVLASFANPDVLPSDPRRPINKKLHQLDESHDHLFSASFLNSLSGEGVVNDEGLSSAHDVLFDLDFGADPDIGLGEEMLRDLEEAWNMNVTRGEEAAPTNDFNFDDA